MSFVKKAVKSVTKFVKKHWKPIAMAAAVVFTAGIATVGVAGFSSAAAAAGGGIGGFLSAAGSTLGAGVASIGGSLGIGQGANLAAFGGVGHATLGTGALAQSLGLAGKGAAQTAGFLAKPTAAGAASAANSVGVLAQPATSQAATALNLPSYGAVPTALPGVGAPLTAAANPIAASAAPASGGGFLSSPFAGPALNAGLGLVQGLIAKESTPKQPRGTMFGIDPSKNAADIGPRDVAFNGPVWNPNSFNRPTLMQAAPEDF